MYHRLITLVAYTILYVSACSSGHDNKNEVQIKRHSVKSNLSANEVTRGVDGRIDNLLKRMTIQEKLGQLSLYSTDWEITGPSINQRYKEEIKAGRVGAVFNAYTADFTYELQKLAVEQTRLGIPLLFGFDVIHGFKTIFPIPLGESASWDLALMEQSARVAAVESAASGLHWTFAPMIDVARDPRWGRIAEGAGEDTFFSAEAAKARVRGFQGNIGDQDSILACAKHFAAYGAAEGGRDYNTVDVSERTLREVYLPPFKAAVEEGVASFMTAFNEIAGVPSTSNKWLLKQILRDEWGFDGFVVTDYTSINELVPHGVAENLRHAGELAFEAGVDMDMEGGVFSRELPDYIAESIHAQELLDDAVGRILKIKFDLGLFDNPYKFVNQKLEREKVYSAEHLDIARKVAKKSIVLLKNQDDILPISPNLNSIAVIGPLANDKNEPLGSWKGAGEENSAVSLLEGIRARVSGTTVVNYAKGCDIDSESRDGFDSAIELASKSEVIIAAFGEMALMSGEAASRSSLDLPGVQLELLKELASLGKPLVLILMNGRPLVLNWPDENVSAILETWFLGTQTGHAIADVLFGDYNPSGRLPVSFPRSVGQIPVYYNSKNTGRPFAEEQKYTSKYLDVANTPLYPFGYGLSYTQFGYSDLKVSSGGTIADHISVSVFVSNDGSRAGIETVQLYVTDLVGSVTRPVKELRGFQQVFLEPGEKKKVSFKIEPESLSFYDINMDKLVEPGGFEIHVGKNSEDVLTQKIILK